MERKTKCEELGSDNGGRKDRGELPEPRAQPVHSQEPQLLLLSLHNLSPFPLPVPEGGVLNLLPHERRLVLPANLAAICPCFW